MKGRIFLTMFFCGNGANFKFSKILGYLGFIFGSISIIFFPNPADATPKIVELKSPVGVKAWLVQEPSIPTISIEIAFRGGAFADPAGKEGLASMVASLLDEGAGIIKSRDYQERLQELAIGMSTMVTRDNFYIKMRTLVENKKEAFQLLGLALSSPRFDSGPLERIREQALVGLAQAAENPNVVASEAWFRMAFPRHKYGRPSKGTFTSIKAITKDDLIKYVQDRFTIENAIVGVVGDVTPAELSELLDFSFNALPLETSPLSASNFKPSEVGGINIIRKKIPQTVAVFGLPGIKRTDPDFYAAYLMNHILGGGGFTSRLYREIREKKGLAYSVYTSLYPFTYAAVYFGAVASANERIGESLRIIREELLRVGEQGVTTTELEAAKTFVNGSFPLQLDSNAKMARNLVEIQLNNLGIDYIRLRSKFINSVTLKDIRRVSKRLLGSNEIKVVLVGDPVGIQQ